MILTPTELVDGAELVDGPVCFGANPPFWTSAFFVFELSAASCAAVSPSGASLAEDGGVWAGSAEGPSAETLIRILLVRFVTRDEKGK